MAVLGAQLVITLVTISIIRKLSAYYSLAKWFLCSTGLTRYLYPTNQELKALIRVPKKIKKANNAAARENGKVEKFFVPKTAEIELEKAKVVAEDVGHLRHYEDFFWLVDFALYTAIVYTLTEIYSSYFSIQNEINLSIIWCIITHAFALKIVVSLTMNYFTEAEAMGERSAVIVSVFFYLVLVMVVLIVDESKLETGLDAAYGDFSAGAFSLLQQQGFESKGPASKLILRFCLALWCSVIGATLVFPGFRLSKMHLDSLRYCDEKIFLKILLHVNFITPLLILLLWIKPISRDLLTQNLSSESESPLLSEERFESLRLYLIVGSMLLRLSVMPVYLQAYLNMAYDRVELMKKEAGRITNVELQKKVASVFYYMCVVALQYVIPLVMCLNLCFMYKTLGNYSWSEAFASGGGGHFSNETVTTSFQEEHLRMKNNYSTLKTSALERIFTKNVYRGLLGFATWWTCFSWFASSIVGLFYHKYISSNA